MEEMGGELATSSAFLAATLTAQFIMDALLLGLLVRNAHCALAS